jgi:hypothetical protein
MAINRAQINTIKDLNLRNLCQGLYDEIDALHQATGTNFLSPVNSAQTPASAPPATATLSVTGANGSYDLAITNPPQSINKSIFHEISYSSKSNFSQGVATLPVSTATKLSLALPGATVYFRIRSSFDQTNWNSYQAQASAVSSGLQSSAATENANVLNQTNYANVDSVSVGASANVRIYGKAGPATQYPAVKGAAETILPSATIINVPLSSTQVVGFDGTDYQVRGTLPEVLADGTTPTGSLSVVGGGTPTPPTIVPIVSGGQILGFNVTNGGAGATGPYTLTFGSVGGGSGATFGAQTISGGVLIAVAPGNPGAGYSGGTTVTATGGTFGGVAGGGRSIGGNGGRLVVNDGTTG